MQVVHVDVPSECGSSSTATKIGMIYIQFISEYKTNIIVKSTTFLFKKAPNRIKYIQLITLNKVTIFGDKDELMCEKSKCCKTNLSCSEGVTLAQNWFNPDFFGSLYCIYLYLYSL